MKKTVLFAVVLGIAALTSCSSGYTCPTYMNNNSLDKVETLAKVENQSVIEKI